jgi:peptidoglycan biosynthesis protein MviN/MurJ (putative lipid II flippase)
VATLAGPGVVALLGFAATLVDTISTIASKLIAYQVGQPIAASLQSSRHGSALSSLDRKGIVLAVLGSIAAYVLILMAVPLVRLFYAGGAFQEPEVSETARYVGIMAIGLPAALITAILLYPLLAIGRHGAALIQVGAFLLHIAFVRVAFEVLQGAAVAWAYVILLYAQAAGGWFLVKRYQRNRSST